MAWYGAGLEAFLVERPERILEQLRMEHGRNFELLAEEQYVSWDLSIRALQETLRGIAGRLHRPLHVFLEYPLRRLGRRIDCVLLAGGVVIAAEFKRGPSSSPVKAARQAEDYAFSLKHFHEASHALQVYPVAVGDFRPGECRDEPRDGRAAILAWDRFGGHILGLTAGGPDGAIDPGEWARSGYRSSMTIIEAATEVYNTHSVDALGLTGADEWELGRTTAAVMDQVQEAMATRSRRVVFVTGAPGAGKTLVGLSVVQQARGNGGPGQDNQAVLMSGNGPLVRILRESLIRDARRRLVNSGRRGAIDRTTKESIEAFIREMHRFTADHAAATSVPVEHVLVFDEAQRAWDREKCSEYARKRARRLARSAGKAAPPPRLPSEGPGLSEPETILQILGRKDWAVLVCLVGPGQEIYLGEGGLACWWEALEQSPEWTVCAAPELRHYLPDNAWPRLPVKQVQGLHLPNSRRCHPAENVTRWLECVLEGKPEAARELAESMSHFPFGMCRDKASLCRLLRSRDIGNPRIGILASSGGLRLRAFGFEPPAFGFTQEVVDPVEWFLGEPGDIRSSNQMEVAMSEFESQGLELDVTGVCWGGDLLFDRASRSWRAQRFSGAAWREIPASGAGSRMGEARYILNKYRVLLTRFRRECIIMVPRGDPEDETQLASQMEEVAGYLEACGVKNLA